MSEIEWALLVLSFINFVSIIALYIKQRELIREELVRFFEVDEK